MEMSEFNVEENQLTVSVSNIINIIDKINDHSLMFKVRKNALKIREDINIMISEKSLMKIPDIREELDGMLNSFKIFYVNGTVDQSKYEEILSNIEDIKNKLKPLRS